MFSKFNQIYKKKTVSETLLLKISFLIDHKLIPISNLTQSKTITTMRQEKISKGFFVFRKPIF